MSYPHLFPSGFLEFQDSCSGPLLYRNQPSRESNGVRLNDYMQKYNVGQYKGGDFLRMGTQMRNFSRQWDRLPNNIKKQFTSLISESDMVKDKKIENFGDVEVKKDNKMSIFIIIVVAIVAVVIGFLVACVGS